MQIPAAFSHNIIINAVPVWNFYFIVGVVPFQELHIMLVMVLFFANFCIIYPSMKKLEEYFVAMNKIN